MGFLSAEGAKLLIGAKGVGPATPWVTDHMWHALKVRVGNVL
jgi:hypothetical protein